jgi:hypothetical protein
LRVADVVELFSPAKKARAQRKLASDGIPKAKQTKERCRPFRPADSDDDSDNAGCDKLSSGGKSKGKAKGKAKAKAKGKGKVKGKGKANQPKTRYSAYSDDDSDYNASDDSDYMG